MAAVLVIDASASVRETLRIVLGHEHDVTVRPSLDQSPPDKSPDVVVLGLPAAPRDDRSIGELLALVAPSASLLLLHPASDVELQDLVPPQIPVEFLPKPFDAYGVRARVRILVEARRATPPAADVVRGHRRYLEHPYLSQSAAAIARRVVTVDVPVILIQGEPGTGAEFVARALHVVRGRRGTFATMDAAQLAVGDLEHRLRSDLVTILLMNLDLANPDIQRTILQFLEDQKSTRFPPVRIVGVARRDLGELAAAGTFLHELAFAVTTLPIVLEPLRDRSEDIPSLVALLTRELCERLRLEAVTYSDAALERLTQYLWFGNVAEMEAVLARTLTLHRPSVVEADHLVFFPEDVPRAMRKRTGVTARPSPPEMHDHTLAGLDLEVVLGELAHELRNPMVTIKTFAHHLDSVLADPEARARFSALTSDAISRMDGLLETLLEFSRFRAPALQSIDLRVLLDRVLGERAEDLARRHVNVELNGEGTGSVEGDEAQVLFALRSVLRGLVSDLVPHTPIRIRAAERGIIEMEVRAEASTAARLAAWIEPRSNASAAETPPLAWALAAALLERNGGALTVRKGDHGTSVIRVDWTRLTGEASNGTTGGEDGSDGKT